MCWIYEINELLQRKQNFVTACNKQKVILNSEKKDAGLKVTLKLNAQYLCLMKWKAELKWSTSSKSIRIFFSKGCVFILDFLLFADFSPHIKQTGKPVSSAVKANYSAHVALNLLFSSETFLFLDLSMVGLSGVKKLNKWRAGRCHIGNVLMLQDHHNLHIN